MIGIYSIKNKINGKVYVGQSINIERRWITHKRRSRQGDFERSSSPLYSAIKKYGLENFEFTIIEECPQKDLDEREIYWIKQYNSTNRERGYNICNGGKNPPISTKLKQEEIEKIYELLVTSFIPQREIAEMFDISQMTISSINNGYRWINEEYEYPLRSRESVIINYAENNSNQKCIDCGKKKSSKSKRCRTCSSKHQRAIVRPPALELARLVKEKGFTGVGKMYGVTDNAIKKWCQGYNIPCLKTELINWYNEQIGIPSPEFKKRRRLPGVIQKDLSGNILNSFETLNQAVDSAYEQKISKGSKKSIRIGLTRAANKERKTYCGFIWDWISPPEEYLSVINRKI